MTYSCSCVVFVTYRNCVFQKRWVKFDGESLTYYNNDKVSEGFVLIGAHRPITHMHLSTKHTLTHVYVHAHTHAHTRAHVDVPHITRNIQYVHNHTHTWIHWCIADADAHTDTQSNRDRHTNKQKNTHTQTHAHISQSPSVSETPQAQVT